MRYPFSRIFSCSRSSIICSTAISARQGQRWGSDDKLSAEQRWCSKRNPQADGCDLFAHRRAKTVKALAAIRCSCALPQAATPTSLAVGQALGQSSVEQLARNGPAHLQGRGRHLAVVLQEGAVIALQAQVQQVGLVVPGGGVVPAKK
jgi:hypothetical protein